MGRGALRARRETSVLAANNDYQAVQAWLELSEPVIATLTVTAELNQSLLAKCDAAVNNDNGALDAVALTYREFALRRPHPYRLTTEQELNR